MVLSDWWEETNGPKIDVKLAALFLLVDPEEAEIGDLVENAVLSPPPGLDPVVVMQKGRPGKELIVGVLHFKKRIFRSGSREIVCWERIS
jgi:hypothetical protein